MAAMAKSQKSNRTNIGPAYERSGVQGGDTKSHATELRNQLKDRSRE